MFVLWETVGSQINHKQRKLHVFMIEKVITAIKIRKHCLSHKSESLFRDWQKLPRLTVFQVIQAGYWVKFSTSKNHVSVKLHRLWNCLCERILVVSMSLKWAWFNAHNTHGAILNPYWTYSTLRSITWLCCTLLACSLQTPPSIYNCNPGWMETFETLDNLVFEIHDYHGQVYSNQTPVKQKSFSHCKGCNFPLSQMTVNPKLQINLWFLQSSSWDYIPRITLVGFVETRTTRCL